MAEELTNLLILCGEGRIRVPRAGNDFKYGCTYTLPTRLLAGIVRYEPGRIKDKSEKVSTPVDLIEFFTLSVLLGRLKKLSIGEQEIIVVDTLLIASLISASNLYYTETESKKFV